LETLLLGNDNFLDIILLSDMSGFEEKNYLKLESSLEISLLGLLGVSVVLYPILPYPLG